MIRKYQYNGYFIDECDDGIFDITDANGDLVDGDILGFDNAKLYIDELVNAA